MEETKQPNIPNEEVASPVSKNKAEPSPEKKDNKHEPILLNTEIIVGTMVYAVSDIFVFLLNFAGLSSIISIPRTLASHWYLIIFRKMGIEIGIANLIIGAITGIPIIGGAIPSTFGWIIIVIIDQVGMAKLKKVMGKMGKAGEFIEKTAKKASKVTGKV